MNLLFNLFDKAIYVLSIGFQFTLIFLLFFLIISSVFFLLGLNILRKLHITNYKYFKKEDIDVSISNQRWKKNKSFHS